jgi:hypothetical protein
MMTKADCLCQEITLILRAPMQLENGWMLPDSPLYQARQQWRRWLARVPGRLRPRSWWMASPHHEMQLSLSSQIVLS